MTYVDEYASTRTKLRAHIDIDSTLAPDPSVPVRALWTDASVGPAAYTWAWVDDTGAFAHGMTLGWGDDAIEGELVAVAEGLRSGPAGQTVHVNVDSEAAVALMRDMARVEVTANPARSRWRYESVLSSLTALCAERTVVVHQVRGHADDPRNIAAHRLAKVARRREEDLAGWKLGCSVALRELGDRFGRRDIRGVTCTCGVLGW
ncbi:RNase H family protein [Curtobacterium sp. YR515]|uniref:RNase H family protein n=1 Tax=Curtobacterium sp. YR515 TaxID=1855316 RepID=UPI000B846764|nr:RNase H family protein [Curtobacterium sp. YR515]